LIGSGLLTIARYFTGFAMSGIWGSAHAACALGLLRNIAVSAPGFIFRKLLAQGLAGDAQTPRGCALVAARLNLIQGYQQTKHRQHPQFARRVIVRTATPISAIKPAFVSLSVETTTIFVTGPASNIMICAPSAAFSHCGQPTSDDPDRLGLNRPLPS